MAKALSNNKFTTLFLLSNLIRNQDENGQLARASERVQH